MPTNNVIKADRVSKVFRLPHEKQNSIKGSLINLVSGGKRSFEKQQVLKDISFEIEKGEFFGIVGRNGSGKSTLLKMLAGIYSASTGHITVKGKLTPFIELGVGFNPELTGRENVFLNGALLGFSRKEMAAMYDDIVEFAELEKFMDQKLKNYSSGMQVRLAFSIAIKVQSDILLIDEVLAVGDAAFQRKCYDYFMLLKRENATVILVTHDMEAVRQYCDRAILIDKGKIKESGSPEKVAQAYMKLFVQEINDSNTDKDTSENRWGNGKLMLDKARASVGDKLKISAVYTAKVDLPAPVLGFSVHGPSGMNILEGNTIKSKIKTQTLQKGDIIKIEWCLDNIFSNGEYKVSIACCDASATEFYDWVNAAAQFSINKTSHTAGVVDPVIETNNLIVEKYHE